MSKMRSHIANDIDYGLAGYVWTSDIRRGHRMAHAIDAGMIWVNSENNRHLAGTIWRNEIERHWS